MADKDGRHSEVITELLCHVMPSLHDADVKGNISDIHSLNDESLIYIHTSTLHWLLSLFFLRAMFFSLSI